jgi:hypothetical protein
VERLRTSVRKGQACSASVAEWDGVEGRRCWSAAPTALHEAKESGRARRKGRRPVGLAVFPIFEERFLRGGGGMADSMPSKGIARKGVWVRIPPAASV